MIVEVAGTGEGFRAQVLDAARVQGKYIGERVLTPCVPA
jgi:hypothetical protein